MTNHQDLNFIEFMEQEVIPKQKANPEHLRLDGQLSEGNRAIFGYFQHFGRTWKVHSDTRYEPLMLAHGAAVEGKDPFVESTTNGGGSSLVLQPKIKERQNSHHKYLYIYEV